MAIENGNSKAMIGLISYYRSEINKDILLEKIKKYCKTKYSKTDTVYTEELKLCLIQLDSIMSFINNDMKYVRKFIEYIYKNNINNCYNMYKYDRMFSSYYKDTIKNYKKKLHYKLTSVEYIERLKQNFNKLANNT